MNPEATAGLFHPAVVERKTSHEDGAVRGKSTTHETDEMYRGQYDSPFAAGLNPRKQEGIRNR